MIRHIYGERLEDHIDEYDVILVGTNLYCSMGQGLQLKLMLDYPYCFEKNLETKYGDVEKLGTIVEAENEGEPTICLCFVTKGYNFRPDLQKDYLEYEALEQCLRLFSAKYKGKNLKIAAPLIGNSKFDGNGDESKISEIFERSVHPSLDFTVYHYEQESRSEQMKAWYEKEKQMKRKDGGKYYGMVQERKRKAEERYKKNGHRRY